MRIRIIYASHCLRVIAVWMSREYDMLPQRPMTALGALSGFRLEFACSVSRL